MGGLVHLAAEVSFLAEPKPKGPEFGKATPLGLFVIVALLAVTFLLIRSMNKHVKNLPESFDDEQPGEGDEAGGTDHAGIESPDGAPSSGRDADGPDGPGGEPPRP
ncbi:hypothetical protein [Tsukamurella sp. 1534]|uniref:hypothetical protein n=1 Tax=Tsukamurella sp. 1534 TaxID=1151061 RepID=UPI0002DB77CE|nr:hypothetical protein [Tsukamurella sp. 1534]